MITLAYDETTGFESIDKDDASATMLAGIVYKNGTEKKYKGNNNTKVEPERARIVAYLRAVCKTSGASFPRDLHSGNANNAKVGRVKQELSETLPEFIKKGTYKGEDLIYAAKSGKITEEKNDKPILRQGIYQIIALYKSSQGKTGSAEGSLDLQSNDVASNLYLNMAEDIIKKGIFLNPYLVGNNEEVVFDLPTRVIGKPKQNAFKGREAEYQQKLDQYERLKKEYDKLGYEHVSRKTEEGSFVDYWQIMSPGHAQQIIKQADKIRPIKVNNISVESIDYDNENSARKFAFLYLSDCICSYLDYELKEDFVLNVLDPSVAEILPDATKTKLPNRKPGNKYPKKAIKQLNNNDVQAIASAVKKDLNEEYAKRIRARMKTLTGNPENMFYYYDDVDACYEKALESVLKRDLFPALSAMYDGRQLSKGPVKRYYTKKWFPIVEDLFTKSCTSDAYQEALNKARVYRVTDNIAQGRLLYIFETLEQNKRRALDKSSEYFLYDLGISAYTHVGNPYKAEECFEKCLKLSNYVEDSDLRESKNRMITVYNDQFRFKDAESMAAGALEVNMDDFNRGSKSGIKGFAKFLRGLLGAKKDEKLIDQIAPPTMRKTSYKAWSSLGQVYAFERAKESEECFNKVLAVLKDEKNADYYITLSYLLQLYIENGDRSKYEAYAKDFFNGEDNIEKQLSYLIKEGTKKKNPRFSFKYALFIYIKAFYNFYKEDSKYEKLLKKLTHVEETVRKTIPKNRWDESLLTGHPWEIIYKYASLLESYNPDERYDSSNRRKIKESVRSEKAFIIDRIIDYGDIEYKKQRIMLNPENPRYAAEYEKSVLKLWRVMIENNCVSEKEEVSILKKEDVLSTCFTYMYH